MMYRNAANGAGEEEVDGMGGGGRTTEGILGGDGYIGVLYTLSALGTF